MATKKTKQTGKVELGAIQIQYPDGTVKQLSLDHARELHKQLDELFGEKIKYVPSAPVTIFRDKWPSWRPYSHFGSNTTSDYTPVSKPTVFCCAK